MNMQSVRCGWQIGKGGENDLEGLHDILVCASRRGCGDCVDCSEKALEMVLRASRKPAAPSEKG
ncbi:hypothetical protein [Magnetospirillum moscoviense]|uniref:Uncharacterized protein n=1 Tax=Magnetospirillum moscoviense TaxID=1437059 RepID=A0A178M4P2_9PROT|nr:hypothetical protein [Magnetospirillum moscoviense]MBF0324165.1 hypothetical protein [Alphaproteobacteria bacterium]OAN43722.1 hypothetical protein A6A05_05090 [Magnetospirillum moscoviense]